jgi:hypothetical protein
MSSITRRYILSDYFWGVNAVVVNEFVQECLFI